MKSLIAIAMLATAASVAHAQAPSAAPAGSTGLCRDGSYSDAASKRGACAGHRGVKAWYAAEAATDAKAAKGSGAAATAAATTPVSAAPAAAPAPTSAATPAATPVTAPVAAPKAPAVARATATGGGNGQVWVNASSKVYHCEGTKYYGTTKAGSYMTEAAALAAGNHADHGKACKAG